MRDIILIAHNLRSCHNVGSLLRTAEGLGVSRVILSGYTPYPFDQMRHDDRLPHIARKVHTRISKTALGAEQSQVWQQADDIGAVLDRLAADGYRLAAVEQSSDSIALHQYQPADKLALLVGREVEGVEPAVLERMDDILEISMFGSKESFNVVQAAAMALFHCRFS